VVPENSIRLGWRGEAESGHHPMRCLHLQIASVQGAAQKKFRWRRPRHTLKGRQDAEAVDRVSLRLALRKAQAEAGDIVLLFADESEVLTHPYLARAWAKCGADLRVPAPGQAKKVAMMGALDHAARRLVCAENQILQ
jgi:DDE superfamily endonuclease